MKNSDASEGQPASQLISRRIAELEGWRGKTLGRMRKLIKQADPDVVEGEAVDEAAFKALVREAVAFNSSGNPKVPKKAKS